MNSENSGQISISNLNGRLFISTRPANKSATLKELFIRDGAEILELPMIEIKPLPLSHSDKKTMKEISGFDWIILTSENGTRRFIEEFKKANDPESFPKNANIAAIGHRTAGVIREHGLIPGFISRYSNAEKFSDELSVMFKNKNPRALWPTGSLSPAGLTDKLTSFCDIKRINLYNTIMPEKIDSSALQRIIDHKYDMIFFFSPSAVKNFCSVTAKLPIDRAGLKSACIGPSTKKACLELNIKPLFMSYSPDSEALYRSTYDFYNFNNINNGISRNKA